MTKESTINYIQEHLSYPKKQDAIRRVSSYGVFYLREQRAKVLLAHLAEKWKNIKIRPPIQ